MAAAEMTTDDDLWMTAFGDAPTAVDYSGVPSAVFSQPPIGTAPFGTRSKEILMRCLSELKGRVR